MLNSKHDTRWNIFFMGLLSPHPQPPLMQAPSSKKAQRVKTKTPISLWIASLSTTGEHQRIRDIIQHSADFVEALNKVSVHLSAPGGQRFPKSIQKPQIFWLAKPEESRPMAWPSRCRNSLLLCTLVALVHPGMGTDQGWKCWKTRWQFGKPNEKPSPI